MGGERVSELRVSELRLVLTVTDYEQMVVARLRDALGLVELADYGTSHGRALLLSAGRATIEIADQGHAAYVDELEVGRTVAGAVRLAFEVADVESTTDDLVRAGCELLAAPTATPWDTVNSRLEIGELIQITVYGAPAQ